MDWTTSSSTFAVSVVVVVSLLAAPGTLATCGPSVVPLASRKASASPSPCPALPQRNIRGADFLSAAFQQEAKSPWRSSSKATSAAPPATCNTAERLLGINNHGVGDAHSRNQRLEALQLLKHSRHIAQQLSNMYAVPREESGQLLEAMNVPFQCQAKTVLCRRHSRYRSMDGTCNNHFQPTWGAANTPFTRLLPPAYGDGIHSLRRSSSGAELPLPRKLSASLFPERLDAAPHRTLTLAHMQWGQLLAHDTTLSAFSPTDAEGKAINCCDADGQLPTDPDARHRDDCLVIEVPTDDAFYAQHAQRCMSVIRTNTAPACRLGPAQQVNGVTAFLDMSMLYGSDDRAAKQLRALKGGLLRFQRDAEGREFLSESADPATDCAEIGDNQTCYKSGDFRVNQNVQLAALMTVLLREHNRLARELSILNPHWSDERLYQESRRLLVAQYQHITFLSYLPPVIGKHNMNRLGLQPLASGFSYDYDHSLNPSSINNFAAASFRTFHSMVEGNLTLVDGIRCPVGHYRYSDGYFRPTFVQRRANLDLLLRGMAYQPSPQLDTFFSKELTEQLFRAQDAKFGLDSESIDILRGRDHGLPPYVAFRRICGLSVPRDWKGLRNILPDKSVSLLQSQYESVMDVDLFVGGQLEVPREGTLLGSTFLCLVAEQVYRWKMADRFFYDRGLEEHSFTTEQLNEIRRTSVSRLICDNGDNVTHIQGDSFHLASPQNPLQDCRHIPEMDLTPWKEIMTFL